MSAAATAAEHRTADFTRETRDWGDPDRRPAGVVARAKLRIVDNFVREIRSHLWIHVAAGLFTLAGILVGGGFFFRYLFNFLLSMEGFGPLLLERLVGIVLLAFFSMLVFSNLIITLSTTYISKEMEFLMAYPVGHRGLFGVKLAESIVYSSWAFALLGVPLFAAYGSAKHAPWGFYPVAAALGLPFLVIPAAVGAMVTMVLSAWLPARKARTYSLGLLAVAIGLSAGISRLMGLRSMVASADLQDFSQTLGMLRVGTVPVSPSAWLAGGMEAASAGRWADAGYWWLCLASTAAFSVQVCLWLVPRFYYKGWALAKEGVSGVGDVMGSAGGWSPFHVVDRLSSRLSRPMAALLGKDFRTFWRDPAQWSQLVILFGLLVIYVANIRGITRQTRNLEAISHHWPTILSFFNIGATCFVLSILTTRFIYPMLSLEGKQYWVVGLAPFPKGKLVWQKWWLCAAVAAGIALTLITLSNAMLQVRPALAAVGTVTVIVLGFGLTSLAVGLGAVFPNFKEDNPARIANGLGGTLNIVASLGYIAANLALELPMAMRLTDALDAGRAAGAGTAQTALAAAGATWMFVVPLILLNLACVFVPMRIGVRRWVNLEFHV